jgi:hypothetical protein
MMRFSSVGYSRSFTRNAQDLTCSELTIFWSLYIYKSTDGFQECISGKSDHPFKQSQLNCHTLNVNAQKKDTKREKIKS